eukprot:TRINITY_DN5092_c0_g1_i1.p1 TRINITY_DN5092_c0_g1~~TRINITY_DN5092_c0_g1_i1.p1  ORF type:complete len:271 (-),score=26.75 TRINITY_DN5092_c0_g1_i1:126-938(-)
MIPTMDNSSEVIRLPEAGRGRKQVFPPVSARQSPRSVQKEWPPSSPTLIRSASETSASQQTSKRRLPSIISGQETSGTVSQVDDDSAAKLARSAQQLLDAQVAMAQLRDQAESSAAELKDAQAAMERLRAAADSSAAELKEAQAAMECLRAAADESASDAARLEAEIERLRSQVAEGQAARDALQAQLDTSSSTRRCGPTLPTPVLRGSRTGSRTKRRTTNPRSTKSNRRHRASGPWTSSSFTPKGPFPRPMHCRPSCAWHTRLGRSRNR